MKKTIVLAFALAFGLSGCAPSAKQLKEAIEKDPSIVFVAIEKDPEKFNSMPTVDYTSLFDLVDEAKTKKIIVWNNVTREWTRFSGEHIMSVKKGFAVSQKDELAQYLMKEDGKKDREWIKKELLK